MKTKLLLIYLLTTFIASTFAQEVGLVAYYPFTGNTADSSGNHHDGTIIGGVTLTADRFGNPNSAYHFNGSTGYISCPNDTNLLKSKNFSFSAWFRVQNRPSGYEQNVILSNIGAYQNSGGFQAVTSNPPGGYATMYRNASHQDQAFGGNMPIDSNTWYHITAVMRYDSVSNTTLISNYLNDVFDDSTRFSGSVNYDGITPLYIGTNYDMGLQRWFLGDIDEVKVYDIALSFNSCTDTVNLSHVGICNGDSINFYGRWIYGPGSFDTLIHTNGACDSLITLSIPVIDPLPPTYVYDTICANDRVLFNGTYCDTTGVYYADFKPQQGCDSMVYLYLTVNPLPLVTFTWDSLAALGDVQLINGNADTAIWCSYWFPNTFVLKGGSPVGGYFSGLCVSKDTFYIAQTLSYYIYIKQSGSYDTITYIFTDDNHCMHAASGVVLLNVCEDIHEISNQSSLQVYPNPATDYVTVEYNGSTNNNKIAVLDMLGRVIKIQAVARGTTKTEIDTRNLSNGLYFLRLESDGIMKSEAKFNIIR